MLMLVKPARKKRNKKQRISCEQLKKNENSFPVFRTATECDIALKSLHFQFSRGPLSKNLRTSLVKAAISPLPLVSTHFLAEQRIKCGRKATKMISFFSLSELRGELRNRRFILRLKSESFSHFPEQNSRLRNFSFLFFFSA